MSIFEIVMLLYAAALYAWVQHLMIKQNRDDRSARKAFNILHEDIENLKKICELQQQLLDDLTKKDEPLPPCKHQFRSAAHGTMRKCIHCGWTEENYQ